MPKRDLDVAAQYATTADQGSATVTLHNPSNILAFAVRLKIDKGTSHRVSREGADEVILPVLWEDNYPELLPGETGKSPRRSALLKRICGPRWK